MKYLLSISLSFTALMTILVLSACKKEKEDQDFISREEFISQLKGEWTVTSFKNYCPNANLGCEIKVINDSVQYWGWGSGKKMYSKSDPILCTF